MTVSRRALLWRFVLCLTITSGGVSAQSPQQAYEPTFGQEGKDVVWVPTPPALVEKMLDMARVTPQDYVIDLGSGDGRNVIAAAKRGARALGVEFNPELVELSRSTAVNQGVADKAAFVQGDLYDTDISQATVLALYLLPQILNKLAPKFLALKPGTRIVSNAFGVDGWKADETDRGPGDCDVSCAARLYIVPARVAGTWRLPQGELTFDQKFQMVSGTLRNGGNSLPITNGRLRGDQIVFTVGGVEYSGRVNGDLMAGDMRGTPIGTWSATRVRP